jgi:hypothetical protein
MRVGLVAFLALAWAGVALAGQLGSWKRPPRPEVFALAERAYECARARGEIDKPILTIVDYSLPSVRRRMWVIDMRARRVLFNEMVAHGANSGENYASAFSNVLGSRQSSLGLFRAEEIYEGRHGYSLRLDGLEPGFNDNARERAIVLHGADYVSDDFIAEHGRLGRSWGCPAVRTGVSRRLIDRIKEGGALFAYYPDRDWLRGSRYLHCGAETQLAKSETTRLRAARR